MRFRSIVINVSERRPRDRSWGLAHVFTTPKTGCPSRVLCERAGLLADIAAADHRTHTSLFTFVLGTFVPKFIALIAASILTARKLAQCQGGTRIPVTISGIADGIRWAEMIMIEIAWGSMSPRTPSQARRCRLRLSVAERSGAEIRGIADVREDTAISSLLSPALSLQP
jgi:hypothetical protein